MLGTFFSLAATIVACGKFENSTNRMDEIETERTTNIEKVDDEIGIDEGWYFEDGTLYITQINYTVLDILGVNTCLYEQPWIEYKNKELIKEIVIDADMVYTTKSYITKKEYADVVDCEEFFVGGGPLFGNSSSLESIVIKRLELGEVTDISYMFANNENLVNVDVTGLNTSNVILAKGLFMRDDKLAYIDLESLDTAQFEDISDMFWGCDSLKNIKVSSWETGKIKKFQRVFSGCVSLEKIDLEGWTINDANVAGMFGGCENLEDVNLSNVTLQNTIAANSMFDERNSIYSYHFADEWDIYVEDHKQIWPIGEDCYLVRVAMEPLSGTVAVCIYYRKLMPDWYKESVQYLYNVSDYTNVYSTENMDVWVDKVDRDFSVIDVLHVMLDAMTFKEELSSDENVIIGNAVDKVEILLNAGDGKISIEDIKDLMEMTEEELEILFENE